MFYDWEDEHVIFGNTEDTHKSKSDEYDACASAELSN